MRTVNLYAAFASTLTLILAQLFPWEYLSCYTDGNPRALQGFHEWGDMTLTIESCASICAGFTLFGVENSNERFCGNEIIAVGQSPNGNIGAGLPAEDGRCNRPCNGNGTQVCGGDCGLSVFAFTTWNSTINPDPTSIGGSPTGVEQVNPSATSTANGSYEQTAWYFDGCFAPNLNTNYIVGIGVETAMPSCLQFCHNRTNIANNPSKPLIYAAIYDKVCFCATSMEAFSLTHGRGSGDTSCAAQCAEDNGIACSGAVALGITTIVPLLPLFPGTSCL